MKAILASALFGVSAVCGACMCVGPRGTSARFGAQTNLVLWDAAHGIEHFVRDASFLTKGKDLGFIAPTPNRPFLSEVDPLVFDTLESFNPSPPRSMTAGAAIIEPASKSVAVVETKDVAGYRATVLRASDAAGLEEWLRENGYPVPAFARAWASPYVRKGWYFTALKVKGGTYAHTGPVRMSFATRTPFNPYSVPAENGRGGHVPLRLFYLSAGTEEPRIGGKAALWHIPEWSVELRERGANEIARELHLGLTAVPEHARLVAYRDDRFGTPGLDDLYFVHQDATSAKTDASRAGLAWSGGFLAVALGFVSRRKRTSRIPMP